MLKKILALFVMFYAALAMAAGVDVNKATDAQLDAVKGIGPATSKAIVTERKKGDFKSWDDLIARVNGIGEKKAEALSKEGLTVNGDSYKHAAATAKKTDAKADAKADAKDAKKDAKETKAEAKAEAKKEKAEAKKDAKEAKAEAKKDAKEAKAEAKKDAASAKK